MLFLMNKNFQHWQIAVVWEQYTHPEDMLLNENDNDALDYITSCTVSVIIFL